MVNLNEMRILGSTTAADVAVVLVAAVVAVNISVMVAAMQ